MRLILCLILLAGFQSVIAQETRKLADFNEVSAATGIKVVLVSSSETKAVVEIENGDPDDVLTEVKGARLSIKFESNRSWNRSDRNRKAKVTVYYKALNEISVSSGAMLSAGNIIKSALLELEGSSGGIMELDVDCEDLSVGVSSGGIVRVSGEAESLKVDVSSGGVMKGENLDCRRVNADASSGGVATFKVEEVLDADASSGGSIRYTGNPEKIRSNSSSSGSIRVKT